MNEAGRKTCIIVCFESVTDKTKGCRAMAKNLTDEQREFLGITLDILFDYDGCSTVKSLKELIDETSDRIRAVLTDTIESYGDVLDD